MKRVNILFIAAIVSFAAGSCSTIVNGSRQAVTVNATPSSAKVYIDGELAGTGFAQAQLKRGKSHVIEVKHQGYRTAKVTTDNSITGWFWGNLICGGIPGGAVDLITGSAYDVDPNRIVVTLDQGEGLLQIPTHENFTSIDVHTADGSNVAMIAVHWQ